MNYRQNTIVCSFDRQSPRLSAHDIHNWLADMLTLTTADLLLVQIDGAQRQVYVKFREYETMHRILTSFQGGQQLVTRTVKYPPPILKVLAWEQKGFA
jgi:hypothetical protein